MSWRKALEMKGMASGREGGWGSEGEKRCLRSRRGDEGEGGEGERECLPDGVQGVVHTGSDKEVVNGDPEVI